MADNQIELDGRRVDRPLWTSPFPAIATRPTGAPGARPAAALRPHHRLPRFRLFVPDDHPSAPRQLQPLAARPDVSVEIEVARREPATDHSGAVCSAVLRGNPDPADLFATLGAEPIHRPPGIDDAGPGSGSLGRRRGTTTQPNSRSSDPRSDGSTHPRIDSAKRRSLRRRLQRKFRVPATTSALDTRSKVWGWATAALVVAAVMAFGMQSKVQSPESFVTTMGPLHRDRRVVEPMAERMVDTLVGDASIAPEARERLQLRVTEMMSSEGFDPIWRQALAEAHDAATGGTAVKSSTSLDRALPELAAYLSSQGIESSARTDALTVTMLQGSYTTTLEHALRLLGLVTTLLPLLAVALGSMAILRAPNRLRLGTLIGSRIAGLALVGVALSFFLPGVLARIVASDATIPATQVGAGQLMPLTRLLLLTLAIIAVVSAMAGRLEEIGAAPPFRTDRTRHDELDRQLRPSLNPWTRHGATTESPPTVAPVRRGKRSPTPRTRARSDSQSHRPRR